MDTALFDYDLPPDRIAQHPIEPRDASRMMVLDRRAGAWSHRRFADLPELLKAGDLLVRNATRVVPARLVGRRVKTGGGWEGLFLRAEPDGGWIVLGKTRGRIEAGEDVEVGDGLRLTLLERHDRGAWKVRPSTEGRAEELLAKHGHVPLPPYIRKGQDNSEDRLRYQTTYAQVPGAVAAPTAGLHFTDRTFDALRARGIGWADITLHVGLGTFRPIETDRIDEHTLHAEWAEMTSDTADTLNRARHQGGRIVAVGTTAVRTLEASAAADGTFRPLREDINLYLKPGSEFRGTDALLTNFHLPRSTLLVLIAAFAGLDLVRAAYAEAIREGYRFYSYGDCMLIV